MNGLDEVLHRLAAANELTTYVVAFVGLLTFLGLVMTTIAIYLAYVDRRAIMRMLEEARLSAERQNYYLFNKLGPVDLPPP